MGVVKFKPGFKGVPVEKMAIFAEKSLESTENADTIYI